MGWMPLSPWKLGAAQKITTSGTSAQNSPAFGSNTRALLLSCTADCHVRTGQNPTAVSTDTLVKAAWPPIVIGIGQNDLIAVIQDASGGSLYVTELSH